MLSPTPGREEEARYWLETLSVNRAIMSAIDASETQCPPVRRLPTDRSPRGAHRRDSDCTIG